MGVQVGLSCYYASDSTVPYNQRISTCHSVMYEVWEADASIETEFFALLMDQDMVWAENTDAGILEKKKRQDEEPASASGWISTY